MGNSDLDKLVENGTKMLGKRLRVYAKSSTMELKIAACWERFNDLIWYAELPLPVLPGSASNYLWLLEKGAFMETHTHGTNGHIEVFHILKGKGFAIANGKLVPKKADDWWWVDITKPHGWPITLERSYIESCILPTKDLLKDVST